MAFNFFNGGGFGNVFRGAPSSLGLRPNPFQSQPPRFFTQDMLPNGMNREQDWRRNQMPWNPLFGGGMASPYGGYGFNPLAGFNPSQFLPQQQAPLSHQQLTLNDLNSTYSQVAGDGSLAAVRGGGGTLRQQGQVGRMNVLRRHLARMGYDPRQRLGQLQPPQQQAPGFGGLTKTILPGLPLDPRALIR